MTTTLLGLGAFPSDHALSLHMLGMHGGYARTRRSRMRLPDRGRRPVRRPRHRQPGQFAPQAKIIHIDIDPSSISKNIKVHVPIVGDARRVLAQLVEAVRQESAGQATSLAREAREQWLRQLGQWQQKHPFRYDGTTS